MTNLTEGTKALFIELVEDADQWNGQPLYQHTARDTSANGHLTDLKKKGLVTSCDSEGDIFIDFTDAGIEYAASIGLDLSWI